MTGAQKRIGRPTKRPKPGQRVSLGLKVTAEVKSLLDGAASKSGRTQSQEAEYRIDRTFDRQELLTEALELAYGPRLAVILKEIGDAMKEVGPFAALKISGSPLPPGERWLDQPYPFRQALRAVFALLRSRHPKGDPRLPDLPRPLVTVTSPGFPQFDERALLARLGESVAARMIEDRGVAAQPEARRPVDGKSTGGKR